ncbi:uncharacterized protein LOC128179521 [Crassostrea angulata]|uniref:uncharacterized protein LOC128179521 n=1 Tax=Magallana angulata TaxID=2784310 RepID=UPI0022B0CCD5|nr:uncharacterized protein LOC128179521 [Crassostrea angulata]
MELRIRLCATLLGIFLSVGLLQYECKELDGYKFPVYSTELCPRNQTEWNERSSAINCTKDNGYLCFPNEKFTQLLEFCYRTRFIWIQEGYCLYLKKDDSTIYSYSCSSFQFGCHNSSFQSYDLFKHSGCTSIGNGCFLAEPSCKGSDTATSLPETTKPTHVENVTRNYSTTASTDEKTNQTLKYKDYFIYDELFMMPILAGVLIPIIIFCMLCIIYRTGIRLRKRCDDEEQQTETALELSPLIQTDKRDNAVLIEQESPLDRAIFMQWQDDNRQFVSTRACKEVEELIKSQNLVVVTGNSGSGKSAIIHHIALGYRSQGWTVKPVYNVKEITDTYSSVDVLQSRILFVFNDPIGNESFDEIAYNSWKEHDERLKACLKNNKMLLSSRKYILLDYRVRGILNDKSCIIDLSDDKHKLNNEEKENILRSYSSTSCLLKDDIDGILMTEEYFPLLCKLFFSDKYNQTIGPRFFKEPFNVCQEQIRNFRKECKDSYCALVLLVLCNNQLCVEDIQEKDCLREKFKLALKLCEMKKSTAPHTIGDALKTLEGFFVKKIEDTYHFYHDFVMEVTTYVFGTDYPRETIQYADIGLLRRRVNLKSSNDNRKEKVDIFTIYLNDKYVSDLVDRLFNDLFGDRMFDVVLNPCMRNEKVATYFIKKLKDSPEKLHKLLAKKQLDSNFEKQEDKQELQLSFGSKLEFLNDTYGVQILSAIIVFCHTNISKHCLETLQRMQNSLKDTSLFFAVCCNGSMNLFNVFPKEQIETFMKAKWRYHYPIHIVSLFHNHEILRVLIQMKNDVNLITLSGYGYTPLMLAVSNTDTSERKNKETKNQPTDITVELLMNHGADINFSNSVLGGPLHIASSKGNDHNVELLLNKEADISSCNTYKETPVHKASEQGNDSTVQLLLEKGANINSCALNKETPLHKAIKCGRESTAKLLLDKGADINLCDTNGEAPLHKASEFGPDSTVQLLLNRGADINSCDTNKETPLHKASVRGHDSIVRLLLDKGANINLCDKYKETPLHKACGRGHKSTVQLLLDKGADINSFNTKKETPLHKASEWGRERIEQMLLNMGADINSCTENKETPLHKASENGPDSTVQLLLNRGADINSCDTNKETPLHKASKKGHERIVQLLLDEGADINSCDTNKETPLHKASEEGHENTVQLLLDKGADINSCDTNKETPLHKASIKRHERIVQLLLDKGADINSCDTNKETPLHKASKWGRERIVQLLLDKGADINSCDTNKETPLHKASLQRNERIVQLLLDKGADINSCDTNKETPLHQASKCGRERIVQLLLDKGADINSCDTKKETPLHKASEWGRERNVQLLLDKGADINSCDANKETPIHKASSKIRNTNTVQLLLDNRADIYSCDINEETPLHKAIKCGSKRTVQLLLDNGAGINLNDTSKETLLL